MGKGFNPQPLGRIDPERFCSKSIFIREIRVIRGGLLWDLK